MVISPVTALSVNLKKLNLNGGTYSKSKGQVDLINLQGVPGGAVKG